MSYLAIKSLDLVELMERVRSVALPADWNEQKQKGERRYSFSRNKFDEDLYIKRPSIGTSNFLKTVYIYNRDNQDGKERALDSSKVVAFLEYIFHDIATPHGWPNTVKEFKDFKNGEFYPMIEGYVVNSSKKFTIPQSSLVKAGASSDAELYTQLLQLAVEAKTKHDAMSKNLYKAQEEKTTLEEALKEKAQILQEIREKIARLEGILSQKGGDQKELKEEIKRIKQKIG